MEKFLYCHPNVLVVKNCYEILVNTTEYGVIELKIGKRIFHENHTGIMPSQTLIHKFRVPQKALDAARGYTLIYRAVPDRKNYFTEVGEEQIVRYPFRPIEKTDDIHVIYTADIHDRYEKIRKMSGFFGRDLDLYIVNGDFGESSSRDSIRKVNKLIGDVTGGEIPALIGRGNHDTRGKMAECVTEYMAIDHDHAFFDFSVGPLSGVILDCGEDKRDSSVEYNRLNFFEDYRREELRFLRRLKPKNTPFRFAVCHVPFMHTSAMNGIFAIMPETYAAWNREIERLQPEFMISGHIHALTYIGANGCEGDCFPHTYPVVTGSYYSYGEDEAVALTAVTLRQSGTEMRFVDENGKVLKRFRVSDGAEIS